MSTDIDPVTARIARLLDNKRRDNAEVLGAYGVGADELADLAERGIV